jgi:PAS domain-containing protein
MKLLANPLVLRTAVVFICATFSFLLGMFFMRRVRESITEEAEMSFEATPSLETMPLHVYNTVIRQLQQQKHELQAQSHADLQRARISDTFSQSVFSNLSCGVLLFSANGLVSSSNPAAKRLLGFASTTGMGAEDIFRGAVITNSRAATPAAIGEIAADASDPEIDAAASLGPVTVADEVDAVLREGSNRREVEAEYETPAGDKRFIAVTISPVRAVDGELLGVTCLISDFSELEGIRRNQSLHGEISADMALRVRRSLSTISGYAQQLAGSSDPMLARQIASDIAQEAADLDTSLGGFLDEKRAALGAAAGAGSGR